MKLKYDFIKSNIMTQEKKTIEYTEITTNIISINIETWDKIWNDSQNPTWGKSLDKLEEMINLRIISGRYDANENEVLFEIF